MDAVTWNYVERAGAPPDGEPWFYLGYDANRQPHIMRWYSNTDTGEAYWLAISLQDHPTRNCEPVVLDCLANADDDVRRAFRVVISVSQYIEIAVSTQTTVQRDN